MASFDLQASLERGVQAAGAARDLIVGKDWADTWKDFAVQSALSEQANAHELEMWNLNNSYNSPAAQMQRLKDAGLNPMLAYNMANSGNSSSVPGTHQPNVRISPDADKQAKINTALNVVQAVGGLIGQAMSTIDQGLDLALKKNTLDWSNWQSSAANAQLLGYGFGNRASQVGFLGNVGTAALDPNDPNFDPVAFNLVNRLGISNYYPKQLTAEANASLAGQREKYQQWYNEKYAPLLEDFLQGRIDVQDYEKRQREYADEMRELLPPWMRGIVLPLFDYIRPLINTLLRNR